MKQDNMPKAAAAVPGPFSPSQETTAANTESSLCTPHDVDQSVTCIENLGYPVSQA